MRLSLEGLMSAEDIAAALKLSVRQVRDRLVQEADFPRPAINRRRFRRWQREAIEAWLGRQAALAQRGAPTEPARLSLARARHCAS